ncbi:MAG: hypothetical protein JO154_14765 [Chitinophaga sp.]|uniref:hypothetical protein n=1 Tax=Chitinophaga sp. TaxID=1869181 RepID=UPI0025C43909|nr:hypothetical protein [Chitinophaga sp.]MBV8253862.1 hypothetical protein [Chitinophaga sp.]
MNYKKCIVFSISFLAVFFGNIIYTLSCGGDTDPYDYYISYFNPYLKGQGYEPFFYTSLERWYDDEVSPEWQSNVEEWKNYTGEKGISTDDIFKYIYHYSREQMAQVSACSAGGNDCMFPDSVKNNGFAQFLKEGKNKEAARYLLFAKDCEKYVNIEDRWADPVDNTIPMQQLLKQGTELVPGVKDKEIAQRYKFQLLRLKHYTKAYAETIQSFDRDFSKATPNSLIYNKALALKGGALLRLKDSVNAAYVFSKVFENAASQRRMAFTNIMWSNTAAKDVFPLCRNNKEKANVVAIFSFATPTIDISALRTVNQLDPQSPAMNVLLAREINKLEDEYMTPAIQKEIDSTGIALGYYNYSYYYHSPGDTAYKPYVKQLQRFTDSIADKGNVKDPDYWKLSAAYIAYVRRDMAGAKSRLSKYSISDPAVKDAWELVKILVTVNQQQKIDPAFEAQLLPSLKWLDTRLAKQNPERWYNVDKEVFFNKAYRNLLTSVLAPAYRKQGDYVKEALVRGRCDSIHLGTPPYGAEDMLSDQMTAEQLIAFSDFMKGGNKSAYESYLASYLPKGQNMNLLIGRAFMRVNNFTAALPYLKKVPVKDQPVSYQVFVDQLQDFGDDKETPSNRSKITISQFCEQMVNLIAKTKTTPVDPKVYHKLATGLFNLSYYGKTYYFLKDYRHSTEWYTTAREKDPFERQYYGVYDAEIFYAKAAQAATDKEFKARCLFLAARCSQKHVPENEDSKKYYNALMRNRYFPVLTANYVQTQQYQEVFDQCSYLQDYVRSTKKK